MGLNNNDSITASSDFTGLSTSSLSSTSSSSSSSSSVSGGDSTTNGSDLGAAAAAAAAAVAFGAYYSAAGGMAGSVTGIGASTGKSSNTNQMNIANKIASPTNDLNNNSVADSIAKIKKCMSTLNSESSAANRGSVHDNSDEYDDDEMDDEDSYGKTCFCFCLFISRF